MLAGNFDRDVTFTAALRRKDVDYALRLADTLGVGAPFGAAADAAFRQLLGLGYGDQHEARVIEVARGESPPNRRL
jgi:3-hydroxyisobutyrate dehydrogenase-like beta-hydroxyacid dehydrogenase